MALSHFKLVFFVPRESTSAVLDKLFRKFPTDLGKMGNYERCAFIQQGTGQFMAMGDAKPTIGSVNKLKQLEEDRVEITLFDSKGTGETIRTVIQELRMAHPYEEVAYDVYKLADF